MNFLAIFSFIRNKPPSRRRSAPAVKNVPRSRLRLEPLEDRFLPSANVISGYVYHDANNNGLFEAGETPLANVQIQLVNSSNVVVGNTTTNAQGFYQFGIDQTISTSPQTLIRTVSLGSQPTDFTRSVAIGQFDPSLGKLLSVQVINSGAITSDIRAENTSSSSPSTITATVSGTMTLSGPHVLLNTDVSRNAGSLNASVFDGSLDFGGRSGKNFGPHTANGSGSMTMTGAAMSAFVGTGSVSMSEIAHATSSASGGGNLIVSTTSLAQANITVIYHYIPSNSLRPGNYTIVEVTQPPGYLDGQISRNGVILAHTPGVDRIPVTLTSTDLPNNDFGKVFPPATVAPQALPPVSPSPASAPPPPAGVNKSLLFSSSDFWQQFM
jgi:hypothetical protein